MTNTDHDARERRTSALLATFRGNRDEFMMLKGILCMDHGACSSVDQAFIASVFNQLRIAERMDEINAEARASVMRTNVPKGGQTAEQILDAAAARTGWNADSQVQLMLEYIENQRDNDTFADFIAERVAFEEGL